MKHKRELSAKIKTICNHHTWRFWRSDCIRGEDQRAENSVILISSLGCLRSSTGAVKEVLVLRDRFASEEMAKHPFNAEYYLKKMQEEISSPRQSVASMFLKKEGVMGVIEAIASSACCSSVFSNLHPKKTARNLLPK